VTEGNSKRADHKKTKGEGRKGDSRRVQVLKKSISTTEAYIIEKFFETGRLVGPYVEYL